MNMQVPLDTLYWEHFATEEQARAFDKKLQALAYLKKWQAENDNLFVPDWHNEDQRKYIVSYDARINRGFDTKFSTVNFDIEFSTEICYCAFFPHLSSDKVAKKMIQECEEQLKIYF